MSALPPDLVSLADYERHAREAVPADVWAYIAGAAADGLTRRWNREAFDRLHLRGRVLADLRGANTRLELMGRPLPHPLLLAPTAYHGLLHPQGELATAQAAAATGTPMVVSTLASRDLAEIAGAGAPCWFQLYFQPGREANLRLVRRAEAAGYAALVLTVDAPVSGTRNQEVRAGFHLPEAVRAVNLQGLPGAEMPPSGGPAGFDALLEHAPRWEDVDWLRTQTQLPIVLKGITDPRDARRAMDRGVDALVVSNHGGRTLDTLPASIDLLPAVSAEVGGRIPLLLDGGIRRGTDILKAIALGADAVMIGLPQLCGLAVAGALGVGHTIALLRTELQVAMALTGCRTLADIDRSVLWTP